MHIIAAKIQTPRPRRVGPASLPGVSSTRINH